MECKERGGGGAGQTLGSHLTTTESLLHGPLESERRTSEVVSRSILNLEQLERLGELLLNLDLHGSLDVGSGAADRLLNGVDVSLKVVLSVVTGGEVLVSLAEGLGVLDHLLNLGGRETADRVGDGDVSLAAGDLLLGRNLEETVGVNLKGGEELSLATGLGRDTGELELAEKTVVLALGSLTLVDGEGNLGLVVLDSGEDTGLVARNGGVTGNNDTENVTLHGNTERERRNVKEEQVSGLVAGLVGQDGGLDSGTVGNSLVGVDALVELAATEELGDKRLDLGDTGGTTDKDDVVNLLGGDLGVLEDLGDGVKGTLEGSRVDLLETGTGDVGLEVNTVKERVNLNGGLGDRGESALGTLARGPQTADGTGVTRDVELVLALELLLEVLKEGVVKVLTTKVGVTSGGLDGEDTTGDVEERDIESTSTKVKDEDVLLGGRLGVETVGNSGSGGLVDDTEDVKASDGTYLFVQQKERKAKTRSASEPKPDPLASVQERFRGKKPFPSSIRRRRKGKAARAKKIDLARMKALI